MGFIQDKESRQKLPNTTIKLGKRGILSDENGKFNLSYNETDWKQNIPIQVSHIGYQSQTIPLQSFKNGSILLIPNSQKLQEVIVRSSARELVKKAIEAIPQNYQSKNFILSGNFIQTVRRSKHDTVFRIDYRANTLMSYQKDKSKNTEVELVNYKKTNSKSIDSANYIHWKKDGKIIQHLDFVHKHHDFLDPNKLHKYNYFLKDIKEINGRSTYHIKFELKSKPQQYRGNVFLDEESLAIITFDFVNSDPKQSEDVENIKEEKSLLHGATVYKKTGNYWFIDSLIYAKSSTILGKIGYISIQFKSDSINQIQPTMHTNFYTNLTADMMMENMEEHLGLPKISNENHSISATKSSKKKFIPKIGYSFGIETQLNLPSEYKNFTNWNTFYEINTPTFEDHNNPLFQSGINLKFNSFQIAFDSFFNQPFSTSITTGNNYEISRRFYARTKNRPLYLRTAIGYTTMKIYHSMNNFIPSTILQQKEEISNELYSARHQINLSSTYFGLQFGIHITRKKSIELGIKYHIPIQWSEELFIRKSSNRFFQNMFNLNSLTISLPFQTFSTIQNNLNFNLTYQL